MHKCKLCGNEYFRQRHQCIVCDDCYMIVLTTSPARLLSPDQRLWGKCYGVGDHWHFGQEKGRGGRPDRIMIDGRQKQASHVALFLSGRPQPSPEHFAAVECGDPQCVRPEHLSWKVREVSTDAQERARLATLEDYVRHVEAQRAKKAKYQRNYRRKLRNGELVNFRREFVDSAPQPIPAPPAPIAPVIAPEPAPEAQAQPSGLLSSLANVPVDPSEYGV